MPDPRDDTGLWRCCEHCADDPAYHRDNSPDTHDLPCTNCQDRAAIERTHLRAERDAALAVLARVEALCADWESYEYGSEHATAGRWLRVMLVPNLIGLGLDLPAPPEGDAYIEMLAARDDDRLWMDIANGHEKSPAALRARIEALHHEVNEFGFLARCAVCMKPTGDPHMDDSASYVLWPCDTIRALASPASADA